jgi:hypothetical protein
MHKIGRILVRSEGHDDATRDARMIGATLADEGAPYVGRVQPGCGMPLGELRPLPL